jgi:chromosome segregation ATPase
MSLEKNKIQGRVDELDGNIKKLQTRLNDLEKERTSTIAQLNAMQGAKQQCTMFLSEFVDEENALVSDPNAKTKDLGTLGE